MAGPSPWNRRWKATLLALLVADAVIVASAVAWQYVWRPRSIQEIIEMSAWGPGTTVDVEGIIFSVERLETTYGPAVLLSLDPRPSCIYQVYGDPNVNYTLGQRFRTSLHFREYRVNGDRTVMAPELPCPFPLVYQSLSLMSESLMLQTQGLDLPFTQYSPDGWATYTVATPNRNVYPLDTFPITLWKRGPRGNASNPVVIDSIPEWKLDWDDEYLRWEGNYSRYSTEIDSMGSLGDPTSRTDRIRYDDANGNRLLDDGDRIRVRLDPTEDAFDSYVLDIAAFPGFTQGERSYSGRYILNSPSGPSELHRGGLVSLQLRFVSDLLDGTVNSTVEVTDVLTAVTPSYASCTFTLQTGGPRPDAGPIVEGLIALSGNRTIDYRDRNANARLDAGDRIVVGGLVNQSSALLSVRCPEGGGSFAWYPGHGYVGPRFPPVRLDSPSGPPPYRISIRVAYPHPELVLNRTLTVRLWEGAEPFYDDRIVVDAVRLVSGTIGTFGNGTLSFADADANGALSTGDYFTLQGSRASDYRLVVSFTYGGRQYSLDIPGDRI